nr:unnamed protein product [Callosobruchus analis]
MDTVWTDLRMQTRITIYLDSNLINSVDS